MFEKQILAYRARTGHTPRPRAALIDMDGTLYDSMPGHAAAWHRMVTGLGLPSDPRDYYLWEGRTGASVIDQLMRTHRHRPATDSEKRDLYALKSRYFNELPPPLPMPGAAAMLHELSSRGVERVLVTGSAQGSLLGRLDTDFPGIFTPGLRVTARNVTHGKPHPEPFLKGMEMAAAAPWECLAIDNAPLGVESGSRAGAFTIGVVTGPIAADALSAAGADIVFGSMPQMARQLPVLLSEMLQAPRL